MRERIFQAKKAASPVSISTLKQPTRGFGLESLNASPPAMTQVQPLNKPLSHDISKISLRPQAKLSISQPGDAYEQEADTVARQVIQRMALSGNRQSIQRQEVPEEEKELQMKPLDISTLQRQEVPEEEEELQMKPLDISTLQRQEAPEEEEELQMKPLDISTIQRQEAPEEEEELQMKPMVQRQANGGMTATADLETSINQARGGGQPLGDDIREPMEQAFGADFGGVKVHTDSQSDGLNQSIQARAFTTGQDIFFRQGEYNPGSRGGQELLAHELTHVVQQSGGMVQNEKEDASRTDNEKAPTDQAGIVQPMLDHTIMRASLYRGMIESSGQPKIGSTARELGVRNSDVELDQQGKVVPGKGMSTAKGSPNNLPQHRRPPSWGGTGKDPVWEIEENNINGKLAANHDGGNHVSITVAEQNMSLEAFQKELAATQANWTKTPEPQKK